MKYNVVGIVFKENGRVYYFDPSKLELTEEDKVIVETDKGTSFGFVKIPNIKIEEEKLFLPIKKVLRRADKKDIEQYNNNQKEAKKAFEDAKRYAENFNLDMRIIDASFTFDRNQLFITFVADNRVDFRELAKKLAQVYRTRIELRQIGVRDKAKEVGGIGPCGRFLCCNSFLTDFDSVSINMAKNQYIALNPSKINGSCGRLLCCLNYEDNLYTELKQGMKDVGTVTETPYGKGRIVDVNIFKRSYMVELSDKTLVSVKEEKSGSNK
jgi:cell fate regulator YaaT (PSP1 superfamily)